MLVLTSVVALGLTALRQVTEPVAKLNEEIFEKRAILLAVEDYLGGKTVDELTDEEVLQIFDAQVQQLVVDAEGNVIEGLTADQVDFAQERKKPVAQRKYPIWIFSNGTEKLYIVAVRGNGLWDEIWGYVALKSDLNVVAGVAFDHKSETPGLGAEIKDSPAFRAQFKGKRILDEQGNFVGIVVRKGGARDPEHEVDAISGATITSDGVTHMLIDGLKAYEPYFSKLRHAG